MDELDTVNNIAKPYDNKRNAPYNIKGLPHF